MLVRGKGLRKGQARRRRDVQLKMPCTLSSATLSMWLEYVFLKSKIGVVLYKKQMGKPTEHSDTKKEMKMAEACHSA